MSKYEDYSTVSSHYDTARTAIGSEIWLGHLAANFNSSNDIHLLDAGCGTGNYTFALANHVKNISALDMNEDMLAKAKEKAASANLETNFTFVQGQLPCLPFEDNSHDVIMFNQVLHHLEIDNENRFVGLAAAIKEAARILRKDGLLFINACSRAQIERAFWYYSLIPEARAKSLRTTISSNDLRALLRANGFDNISRTIPLEHPLLGAANFNAEGPLDPAWRAADSIWAFATQKELDEAVKKVKTLNATNDLSRYLTKYDQPRLQMGQTVFWCARIEK